MTQCITNYAKCLSAHHACTTMPVARVVTLLDSITCTEQHLLVLACSLPSSHLATDSTRLKQNWCLARTLTASSVLQAAPCVGNANRHQHSTGPKELTQRHA